MADENIRASALNDEEDILLDQPLGDGHAVFPADEELHEQLAVEAEGDERTALTAAHQGARGTSTPSGDTTGSFYPTANLDLFGGTLEHANSTNRSFGDALAGGGAGDALGGFDPEQIFSGGEAAQTGNQDGGRNTAAVAGRTPGAAGTVGADADDALQSDGDGIYQENTAALGANGDEPELDFGLSDEVGLGSARAGGGPGGGGEQSTRTGAGTGDDNPVEYSEDNGSGGAQGGGGGAGGGAGGVNPIIGDNFDNNLIGTGGRDMINAKDGDDTLSGGAGDDMIFAGKGDDLIQGGLGDDRMEGGHGDDTFLFSDADFNGTAWTDTVDGQGTPGKAPISDYDTIDLSNVTQGWTLEVAGAGPGAEATDKTNPSEYTEGGNDFSGTITFDDGSTIAFDNIERVDW